MHLTRAYIVSYHHVIYHIRNCLLNSVSCNLSKMSSAMIDEKIDESNEALDSEMQQVEAKTSEIRREDELDHPLYDDAVSEEDAKPEDAIKKFQQIIDQPDPAGRWQRVKEESIIHLGRLYARLGRQDDFKALFVSIRPFFKSIHKSRTAKIVRQLIDVAGASGANLSLQAEICQDGIAWSEQEKRTFLKQRLQTRLASVYVSMKKYQEALKLTDKLVREVKRFDDKLLLVEIYLIESRAFLQLENLPKSKGSLTAARSSANAIYCPPELQAEIDSQAGVLCSADKDYKTAYSYFYESFEGYNTMKDTPKATKSLKYMLLSKIMTGQLDDVAGIISGKAGVKYASIEIEAMKSVSEAYRERDIHRFHAVFEHFKTELLDDPIISWHLTELKDSLLENNLLRLLEPFSRVQVAHVASLIDLPAQTVEDKLSSMILDRKLRGILDQGAGVLILFQPNQQDKNYSTGLEIIKELGGVVDTLYGKAKTLRQSERHVTDTEKPASVASVAVVKA